MNKTKLPHGARLGFYKGKGTVIPSDRAFVALWKAGKLPQKERRKTMTRLGWLTLNLANGEPLKIEVQEKNVTGLYSFGRRIPCKVTISFTPPTKGK